MYTTRWLLLLVKIILFSSHNTINNNNITITRYCMYILDNSSACVQEVSKCASPKIRAIAWVRVIKK